MKIVLALIAALSVPTAAMASVGDAFDSQGQMVPKNVCYTAKNKARMCIQSLNENPNFRTASILHDGETHPSTMFVNCETGHWEFFGGLTEEQANSISNPYVSDVLR